MGMYTALRARVTLLPEFVPLIARLHAIRAAMSDDEPYGPSRAWYKLAAEFPQLPWLTQWAGVHRCDFIPWGWSASFSGEEWENKDGKFPHSCLDGSVWTFASCLKNYEKEIPTFLGLVLGRIVVAVDYCESQYEEYQHDEEPYGRNAYTLEDLLEMVRE